MGAMEVLLEEIIARKAGQLAADLGKAQANLAIQRTLIAICRHELVTHHGLYAHDGDPEEAWQLDCAALIQRIDATLAALAAA